MSIAVFTAVFLVVAGIIGHYLAPTEAEIQARAFVPPTADAGHDDHGHHGGHGH